MTKTTFRLSYSALAVLLILTAGHLFGATKSSKSAVNDIANGNYTDGTYTGTGRGFKPGIKVEVEIEKGEVIRIKVISHNEVGSHYWKRPMSLIPKVIIKEQSTNVDAVGGATYTSRGIIDAVENALKKAQK